MEYNTATYLYRRLEKIIFELQRRYHGTVPLVSEQIWVQHKQKLEEALTTTYRKLLKDDGSNNVDEIVFIPTKNTEDYRSKYMQLQLKVNKIMLNNLILISNIIYNENNLNIKI